MAGSLLLAVLLVLALAVVPLSTARAATTWDAGLMRYPWLTDVTTSSVTVTWATATSTTGSVTWGAPGSCSGSGATATKKSITVAGVTEFQYVATLTGLSADTSYCYRVSNRPTSGTAVDMLGSDPSPVFTTLPAADSTGPVKFAVIGDWGDTTTNGTNPGDTTNGVNPQQAQVMAGIAASGARFVIGTGDTGYPSGSDTNYGDLVHTGKDVSAIFAPTFWRRVGASTPMFNVVGNHGLSGTFLQNWPSSRSAAASGGVFGLVNYPSINGSTPVSSPSHWYAVQAGNVRVYLLDAAWSNGNVPSGQSLYSMDYQAHWAPSSDEYKWLAADLAAHPGGVKIAAFHFPLHSDNPTETSDTYLDGVQSLEGLLSRHDVGIVVNGHAHMYQRNTAQPGLGRMVSYVTGGGGARLEPLSSSKCTQYDAYAIGWSYSSNAGSKCGSAVKPTSPSQVFHFLLVTVNGSQVTVAPTAADGSVFDAQTYDLSPDGTAPSTPGSLTGKATTGTSVSLSWAASTDNVGVTGYRVYRDGTQIGTVDPLTTSYTDASAAAGSTYDYSVAAVDAAGNVSGAAHASVTTSAPADATPPTAPTNVTATAVGKGEVDLSWTASTDDVGVTRYTVTRDGTTAGTVDGATTSYKDLTVQAGTTYTYAVTASDAAGNVSAAGAASPVTTPAPADATPPTAPTNVTATAVGSGEVDLSWTASTDDVGVTGYRVFRDGAALTVASGATTSYQDKSVAGGTAYTYGVQAVDAAGNVSTTTSSPQVTTPAAPVLFSDGFETGDLSKWTSNAGLVVQQGVVDSGGWAARQTSTGTATSAQKVLSAAQTSIYYRARFNVISRGANSVYLIKLRTAGSTNASILGVYVGTNGVVSLRNDAGSQTVYSTTTVTNGAWHDIEVHAVINGTSSSTEIWYDGTKIPALSLATTNLGTTPVGRLQLGDSTGARTYDIALDNVAVDTSFISQTTGP